MVNGYDARTDRMVGHDFPGVRSAGFVQYEQDELELGARAALQLDDPDQAWWVLIGAQHGDQESQDDDGDEL